MIVLLLPVADWGTAEGLLYRVIGIEEEGEEAGPEAVIIPDEGTETA